MTFSKTVATLPASLETTFLAMHDVTPHTWEYEFQALSLNPAKLFSAVGGCIGAGHCQYHWVAEDSDEGCFLKAGWPLRHHRQTHGINGGMGVKEEFKSNIVSSLLFSGLLGGRKNISYVIPTLKKSLYEFDFLLG